jgi:hypothetical protein
VTAPRAAWPSHRGTLTPTASDASFDQPGRSYGYHPLRPIRAVPEGRCCRVLA